ncbi:MAG: uroporphyrinogen-III synthase, partial [Rhodospirillaceae bacterium]|nr:uroporphyrinogen-III synthase [Rhodospirillaceae bacterium]
MRVLITRPAADTAAAHAALTAAGHTVTAHPLTESEPVADASLNLAAAQGFIATDPDGVRALADRVGVRTFPIYCDGPATAAAAHAAGFKTVINADGDAAAIARAVQRDLKPTGGALIYAASNTAPVNLSAMLANMGFSVRQVGLYAIKRARELPAALAEGLASGAYDAVALFTPDDARTFAVLVKQSGLETKTRNLIAGVAAPPVAAPLSALKFARVITARGAGPAEMGEALAAAEREARAAADAAADKADGERRERESSEQAAREQAARVQREAEDQARIAQEAAAREQAEREAAERQRQADAAAERAARQRDEQERATREAAAREAESRRNAERERIAREQAEQ